MLLCIVFCACARLCSLFAAAKHLLAAPSPETARKALLASLPEQDELERRLNRALVADVPAPLRRRRQRLACDLVLVPYHGQPERDQAEVYRGPAKHGTSHFHAYATAYFLYRGQRFTVALTVVRQGEKRGRGPLPAGGPLPVPDAAGVPRSPGGPPQGPWVGCTTSSPTGVSVRFLLGRQT